MSDSERSYYSVEADQLTARLDACLLDRIAKMGTTPTMAELHELGHYIAMHEYLTMEYRFEKSEAERLLRFQDPLEVVVGCTELGCTIDNLDVAFYLDRADPEDIFPMIEENAPAPQVHQTAPEAGHTERKHSAKRTQVR